jgi:hypothetical protein
MNRSYSKIRHIQEANQRLERRFVNEDIVPSENMSNQIKKGFESFSGDPEIKKILNSILKCVAIQPIKLVEYATGILVAIAVFLGEPTESSEEAFEEFYMERDEMIEKLKKLLNPCVSLSEEQVKNLLNNQEFRNFFIDLKKKIGF